MTRNSDASGPSPLTDAAGPGAGKTNPKPPVYSTAKQPVMPAVAAAPKGTPIARDMRKNSWGN